MKRQFMSTLKSKLMGISLLANILVFAVNVVLLFGMNSMSDRIDTVYRDNLRLNEISTALEKVQTSTKDYLDTKTSDSLEEFYRSEQEYREMIDELDGTVTGSVFSRMERDIRNMSERYLDEVEQTIEAKRGRNVEKYRARYESATELYGFIRTYIYSLNNEQLVENSRSYSTMVATFTRFETIGTMVMIMVIIGNIFMVMRLTMELVRPLTELASSANEVAGGNLDIEALTVYSEDEIGVVTKAFNKMVVSIHEYIGQIKKSMEVEQVLREKELMMKAHLKDAQLKYLRAQINPHFLFNTLNAGAQLAMMEGADRTYEYVQRVAEFFRYNVKRGSQTVTVREEIDLVDTYIYILNVRFSGDIHYEKRIDNTLLDVEMPAMILQPIVENCVNHGIREMMGEGCISLSLYRIDDVACVSISDNGAGMTEETIERIMNGTIREGKMSADSNGIGLDNVISRLRLFNEEEDSFVITSDGEGKGSTFTMYLTMKEKKDV